MVQVGLMRINAKMSPKDIDQATLAAVAAACHVSPDDIDHVYDCTPLQVATMAESTIHPGASVFQFILSLSSSVNEDRFCEALEQVVSLNPILRTRLVDGPSGLLQVVTNQKHDTSRFKEANENDTDLARYLEKNKSQPLGLAMPLFRSAIVGSHLVLTMHHAIMDHASLTPLFLDTFDVYHGHQPVQRADFNEFVDHCLHIDDTVAKEFWKSQFQGAPTVFPPVDRGHMPLGTLKMTREVALNDTKVSAAHVPSFLETAWAMTAAVYTSSENVAFGLVLSGRQAAACPAAATTLGPTIAIVPLQISLSRGMTVGSMLKTRAAARRQLQNSPSLQYGVAKIKTTSDAASAAAGFQTLLNVRPRWHDASDGDGSAEPLVTYRDMEEPTGAFALTLNCDLGEGGAVHVHSVADPTVIPQQQLARILSQFEHYLKALTQASHETKLEHIPHLSASDFEEIKSWNSTPWTDVDFCLHDLFRSQAKKTPTLTAVDAWDGRATFRELDDMSDTLSHELQRRKVSGCLVGFCFEKSIWAVAAMLAILKAGGACVPLSTSDPAARRKDIIARASIKLLLLSGPEAENCADLGVDVMEVDASSVSTLSSGPRDDGEAALRSAESLAFVILTSGSTGVPKGVMLSHRNLRSSVSNLIQRFGWQAGGRMLQFGSYVWDIHLGETFGALLSGGTLCIPSEEDRRSRLAHCITSSRIDCAWLTPTVIRTLTPDEVPGLKTLISAGEPVASDASTTWGKRLDLFNGWGPCETSIVSAVAGLRPDAPYPETIGRPANCAIWLTNPKDPKQLVPIGAVGEILIDGPGVAQGYLKDEVKTKAAFIERPAWLPSLDDNSRDRRLYRTGDMARYNPDGSICFVGRQDDQVKIRGQRLDLGEVESALGSCAAVRNVLATTKIIDGRTHLLSIIALMDPALPRESILGELSEKHAQTVAGHLRAIRDHAQSRLPSYMIPTAYLFVERMPQTPSTKLDRARVKQWVKDRKDLGAAVKASASALASSETATSLPDTPDEQLIQSVWSSVLNIPGEHIGRESCFVTLGGDSVLAMHAASQCRKGGLEVTTVSLLRNLPLHLIAENARTSQEDPAHSINENGGEVSSNVDILDRDDLDIKMDFKPNNIEAIVPATDGQATMLAVGELEGRGYYVDFVLKFETSLDAEKLRRACVQVIEQHAILRTVFARVGRQLYQIVYNRNSWQADMVAVVTAEAENEHTDRKQLSFRQGAPLARFHITASTQGGCEALRLEIHHALYDAVSMGLIMSDLQRGYIATESTSKSGLDFHRWVTHVQALEQTQSHAFWKSALREAFMSALVPVPKGATRNQQLLDQQKEVRMSLDGLKAIPRVTPSSVLKAAWTLLLSQALDTDDVVFGEVSANRYLPLAGVEEVRGPCVNQVPVRTRIDKSTTLASLVAAIHEQHLASLPHHHIGTRSIIQECSPWPSWTRFSTAVVYQNHHSVVIDQTHNMCGVDCKLTVKGQLGDATDLHVVAIPHGDELVVTLLYSPDTFSDERIQWISTRLEQILRLLPFSLEQSVGHFSEALGGTSYPSVDVPSTAAATNGTRLEEAASPQTHKVVAEAWKELGLSPGGQTEQEDAQSQTMWDCGADIVTALLLSEMYRSCGYDISTKDVVENPSQIAQTRLLDGGFGPITG
ncbi:putative aminoadipate-semialdehyde dehydrogenase [Emericellopsis atlantica]|uniref:Aminoadipate-semialdehyde dehydrogenase n=1 Tax=Emericellopsis atlantica TaxID=2614577 RepID=A0A9P7ZX64_9HYPO|nr:putative aminoadipate-semialdehyde dehydrogenase [Emericellopsis atlantica]KAG9259097.1 putative aminoadipate-semialdehyde dehydrogenase [Emericellopsis atlantica]